MNWPCEVHTLFRDTNLGCGRGVSEGISWFFEHEPEGIILEDDILPTPGFFPYCDELLARYREDLNVFSISGCNLVGDRYSPSDSYFFSRHSHIWGWATWQRAWKYYDLSISNFPGWDAAGNLEKWLKGDKCATNYWRNIFRKMTRLEIDTWDYQWLATSWMNGGLCALPSKNLTTNLGFGDPDATHTKDRAPDILMRNIASALPTPLVHPQKVIRDIEADRYIQQYVYGLTPARCLRLAAKAMISDLIERA